MKEPLYGPTDAHLSTLTVFAHELLVQLSNTNREEKKWDVTTEIGRHEVSDRRTWF